MLLSCASTSHILFVFGRIIKSTIWYSPIINSKIASQFLLALKLLPDHRKVEPMKDIQNDMFTYKKTASIQTGREKS